jgi:hypothetical protein
MTVNGTTNTLSRRLLTSSSRIMLSQKEKKKPFTFHTCKSIFMLLSFFTSLTLESTERSSGADKGVSLPAGASAIGIRTLRTYRNKNQDIESVEKLREVIGSFI